MLSKTRQHIFSLFRDSRRPFSGPFPSQPFLNVLQGFLADFFSNQTAAGLNLSEGVSPPLFVVCYFFLRVQTSPAQLVPGGINGSTQISPPRLGLLHRFVVVPFTSRPNLKISRASPPGPAVRLGGPSVGGERPIEYRCYQKDHVGGWMDVSEPFLLVFGI